MPQEFIHVKGAREHNLKNVEVTIPGDKLVVITGVSGSGKSSLAFDTIYAEGQRRYVESLSAYARQFLGRMDKPDVDYIEGLSPAISIDQKGVSHNPRSTVGTVTEIYDYLRLLFARAGKPHCPKCGRPVERQTVQQIVDAILSLPEDSRITLLAPKIRRKKGEHKDVFEAARRAGFVRIRVNGEILMLDETDALNLDKQKWHYIELVIDRIIVRPDTELSRVSESVETALREGEGVLQVLRQPKEEGAKEEEITFSEQFACVRCGTSLPEIEPRTFSFNSPHGACPQCTGLGFKLEVDPNLVIPNKNLSLLEGAVVAWNRTGASSGWYLSMMESVARAHDFFAPGTGKGPGRGTPEGSPVRRQGQEGYCPAPYPQRPHLQLGDQVRGRHSQPRTAVPRNGLRPHPPGNRAVHDGPPLPGLQGAAAQAGSAGGQGVRPQHHGRYCHEHCPGRGMGSGY